MEVQLMKEKNKTNFNERVIELPEGTRAELFLDLSSMTLDEIKEAVRKHKSDTKLPFDYIQTQSGGVMMGSSALTNEQKETMMVNMKEIVNKMKKD